MTAPLNDKEIRAWLHKVYLKKEHKDKNTRIIDEYTIGKSIADIVVVSDHIHAIEIKGENDSLARLQTQINNYRDVSRNITVVCPEKHVEGVKNMGGSAYWIKNIVAVKRKGRGISHRVIKSKKFGCMGYLQNNQYGYLSNMMMKLVFAVEARKMKTAFKPYIPNLEKLDAGMAAGIIGQLIGSDRCNRIAIAFLKNRDWNSGREKNFVGKPIYTDMKAMLAKEAADFMEEWADNNSVKGKR